MDENEEQSRQKIVAYLAGLGGSVEDPNGVGLTSEMAKSVGYDRPAGLSAILGEMESEGTIKRDVRGLRTYRISLSDPAPAPPPPATADAAGAAPPGAVRRGFARLKGGPTTEPGQWKEEGLPAAVGDAAVPPAAAAAPALPTAPSTPDATPSPEPEPEARPASEAWRDLVPGRANGSPTRRLPTVAAASSAAPPPPPPSAPDVPAAEAWRNLDTSQQNGPPTGRLAPPPYSPPTFEARSTEERATPEPRERKPKKARMQWWKETPNVSGPPSKSIEWTVIGVGALLAIVAVAIAVVVGLSAPKSGPKARGSGDACPLVTAAEASVVLGGPASPPANILGSCLFESGTKKLVVAVTKDRAKAQYDETRGATAQNVPGIGDSAFYKDGRLGVLKGQNLIVITVQPPTTELSPSVTALAKMAVSRL